MTPGPNDTPPGEPTPEEERAARLEQEKTAAELEAQAKRLDAKPTSGSGSGGNVVKSDLAEAVAEAELAPEDLSGRPPLAEVAEARHTDIPTKRLPAPEEEE